MNGPLAQIVALTCHANAYLGGRTGLSFFPENSSSTFCDSITFVRPEKTFTGKVREIQIALTPDEWFGHLESSCAKGVRLVRRPHNREGVPARMLAGFVDGERWTMEVMLPDGRSEFWEARWEVRDRNAPDQRIWKVTYLEVFTGPTAAVDVPDVKVARERLVEALRAIRSFSAVNANDEFTRAFSDALDILSDGGTAEGVYHRDLAPENFLLKQAGVLLDACQRSWVFGAMGSWNDMGFSGEKQKQYETVSEELYQSLNEAIPAAVNPGVF